MTKTNILLIPNFIGQKVLSAAWFAAYVTKTDVMAMTRLTLTPWLVIQIKSKVLNKFSRSKTKRTRDLPKVIWEMALGIWKMSVVVT